MKVAGEVVVITGAGSGIGAAMARRFAAEGAAGLLLADLDDDAARDVAASISGPPVLPVRVDVADRAAVEAMVARARAEFGPIGLLCSNAGIGTGRGLEADDEDWNRSLEVNVLAHVHAARAALPAMLERGRGALLQTCSAAGLLTMIGDAPYAVSKHAAVAFAEWLALTYGHRGIHVAALCPQGVRTPLLTEGLEAGEPAARAVVATGEVLEPEDVAAAVVAGLEQERFLILPHPEVAEHLRRKATDPDRWLSTLGRVAASLDGPGAT